MPKKAAKKTTAKKPVAKKPAAKKTTAKKPAVKTSRAPKLLRGFKDIMPSDQPYWRYVRDTMQSFSDSYGFSRIDIPVLEETNLFVRTIGKQTDVVSKEMFTFTDASEGSVSLRPEATAGIARAYLNHGLVNNPQPVKLFFTGPLFRRERPQSGRYRQFHQYDFEIIGDKNPALDAQLIVMAYNMCQSFGLSKVSIQVNSIGTPESRAEYLEELTSYYKSKRKMLCEDCKKRLTKNPLRLLDCKTPTCQPLKADAPQIVDWLDEESKAHFMKVIEYLDELDVPYVLNPYLVRGLDYYTHTVFEIWPGDEEGGSQTTLLGGGRYDGLIEQLGGRPTPAVGFAGGLERMIMEMKKQEANPPDRTKPRVFLAQIGDLAKPKALVLFEQLRQYRIVAAENFAKDSLKAQLEIANKLGVKYVLILGQKEVLDGTILIRDMENGVQEVIDFKKTVNELKKKFKADDEAS